MGQWSGLPVELLELIEDDLVLYPDKFRIRAVCAFWNQSLPKVPNHNQFPMIFQVHETEDTSHALFNPIDKKRYLLNLPNIKGMLFKGCSHGWLVTLGTKDDFKSPEMSLVNPLTGAQIRLPSRTKFTDVVNHNSTNIGNEYYLYILQEGESYFKEFYSSDDVNFDLTGKFVLSSDPFKGDDCFIVGIYGPQNRLAYCKLNDTRWTPIAKEFEGYNSFEDVFFHNGKLLALTVNGDILAFENKGTPPFSKTAVIARYIPIEVARDYPVGLMPYVKHLIASSDGGLIFIRRFFKDIIKEDFKDIIKEDYRNPSLTCCFKAYKLNAANSCWEEVNNIGDDVLFVGLNSSFAISSSNCHETYKRNHIYFTDSDVSFGDFIYTKMDDEHSDTGIFNLGDGTLRSLPGFVNNPAFLWPPPLWIFTSNN